MIDYLLGFGLFLLSGGLVAVTGGLERRRQKRAVARRAVRVRARVVAVRTECTSDEGGVDVHYPPWSPAPRGHSSAPARRSAGSTGPRCARAGRWRRTTTRSTRAASCSRRATGGGGCAMVLGVASAGIGVLLRA
ncbi:hypothetical protein [Gemmata sp.]|uniref:hypothetical protein n=1 Tax=Gemmata sp. TaxID=1914242 RepID=UPI003F725272